MNSKKQELKSFNAQQLTQKVNELRQDLFKLRLSSVTSPAKDYKQAGKLRKNIARALTYLHQQQQDK
jgi:ribosomal protein L29